MVASCGYIQARSFSSRRLRPLSSVRTTVTQTALASHTYRESPSTPDPPKGLIAGRDWDFAGQNCESTGWNQNIAGWHRYIVG